MNLRNFIPLKMALLFVTVVITIVILVIAYTGNGPTYFAFLKHIPGEDKTGHVALLFLLSLSVSWTLSLRGFYIRKMKFYYGISATLAFFTAEEFFQILSPYRNFDLSDFASNYSGILIAWLALSIYEKNRIIA